MPPFLKKFRTAVIKAVLYPGDTNLAKSTTEIINKLITYCNLYVPEPQTSDEELNPNNVDVLRDVVSCIQSQVRTAYI